MYQLSIEKLLKNIVTELDYMPLVIDQTGAYIEGKTSIANQNFIYLHLDYCYFSTLRSYFIIFILLVS